jgi:DNA primase
MAGKQVDFAYIRENGNFEAVLAQYGIEAKGNGAQKSACCPFHDDHKPSLKVNTEKRLFNCFACDTGGNIIDFIKELDGVNIRQAAIKVAEISKIPLTPNGKAAKNGSTKPSKKTAKPAPEPEAEVVTENKPLTFQLTYDVEPLHPWLAERGITQEQASYFGLGLCTRGMMKDRIVIPVHNTEGELVAYCGRYPADNPPDDEPKYKFPKGFRKELEVFNLSRISRVERDADVQRSVLIVESFLSVIKHWRPDLHVVSLMGRSISPEQVAELRSWGLRRQRSQVRILSGAPITALGVRYATWLASRA